MSIVDATPADAQQALACAPRYFLWWYTVKSIGCVVLAVWLAYQLGKARAR